MRHLHEAGGASRPFFTDSEFEKIAEQELTGQDLLPTAPQRVRIERFIEKRFGVTPAYEDLPRGILGYTEFDESGVRAVFVSRRLSEERSSVAERRINTTLAHEGGHGLLHAHLFALDSFPRSLFEESDDVDPGRILCREEGSPAAGRREYHGRWWEVQANRMIGALLLPRSLVGTALGDLMAPRGAMGLSVLPAAERREAERRLSDLFDVNPVVARIRIEHLYPAENGTQLTL